MLGNKAIIVEYAAETKDKLEGKESDLNVDSKLFLDHPNTCHLSLKITCSKLSLCIFTNLQSRCILVGIE